MSCDPKKYEGGGILLGSCTQTPQVQIYTLQFIKCSNKEPQNSIRDEKSTFLVAHKENVQMKTSCWEFSLFSFCLGAASKVLQVYSVLLYSRITPDKLVLLKNKK